MTEAKIRYANRKEVSALKGHFGEMRGLCFERETDPGTTYRELKIRKSK